MISSRAVRAIPELYALNNWTKDDGIALDTPAFSSFSIRITSSPSPITVLQRPPAHSSSKMPRGWNTLPPEMNLSVFNLLSLDDLKAFSAVDRLCRQLALPTLFKVRASRPEPKHSLRTNSLSS